MEFHLKSKNEFLVEIFHRYFKFSELAVKKSTKFYYFGLHDSEKRAKILQFWHTLGYLDPKSPEGRNLFLRHFGSYELGHREFRIKCQIL